eukprot:TRINITY_DN27722_c0_g1_i1.p1 TRINITY_DN27722_c0_g1~~TRINITY_DN27722_c0_g1_i1.p1  ORF type:complete len:572 (+),score=47.68 TRINITY_DN27722_c0_g1_i1:81-1796(+)
MLHLILTALIMSGPPDPHPHPPPRPGNKDWSVGWGKCQGTSPQRYNYVGWRNMGKDACAVRTRRLADANSQDYQLVLGFNHNWATNECRTLVAWWHGKGGQPLHPPPPPQINKWQFESLDSHNTSVTPPSHGSSIGEWVCGWGLDCLYPQQSKACKPPKTPSIIPAVTPTPTAYRPQPACKCDPVISYTGQGDWYCSSRSFETSHGRKCSPIQNPGEHCGPNELKCSKNDSSHGDYPPSGKQCGCTAYVNGSSEGDAILCVTEPKEHHGSVTDCSLADVEGTCNAENSTICAMRKIYRVPITPPTTQTVSTLQEQIMTASNVSFDSISINSVCPYAACPNLTCPGTAQLRQREGCFYKPKESVTVDGGVVVVVDFDIEISQEVHRANKVADLFQNVDLVASGAHPTNPEMRALVYMSIEIIDSVYPPAEKTEGPQAEGTQKKSWWKTYWWVIVIVASGCVVVVGTVLRGVRFSEDVDFSASRKEGSRSLPKGLEGCHRTHDKRSRMWRQRSAINNCSFASESEICIDEAGAHLLPVSERIVYRQHMPPVPSIDSLRTRSDSSGSSEPEMVI